MLRTKIAWSLGCSPIEIGGLSALVEAHHFYPAAGSAAAAG